MVVGPRWHSSQVLVDCAQFVVSLLAKHWPRHALEDAPGFLLVLPVPHDVHELVQRQSARQTEGGVWSDVSRLDAGIGRHRPSSSQVQLSIDLFEFALEGISALSPIGVSVTIGTSTRIDDITPQADQIAILPLKVQWDGRVSWGADLGSIMVAIENRIKVAVLVAGACDPDKELPEADPMNFAPHVRVPTILLNGRYDSMFPLDTCQEPLFHALGTPPQNKRLVLFDSGHSPPETPKMKETLDWLDKYLGPVK